MDRQTAKDILARYRSGNCTEAERQLVESWILHGAASPLDLSDVQLLADLLDIRLRLERDLHARNSPKTYRIRKWLPYAAAMILILSVGIWIFNNRWQNDTERSVASEHIGDIAPGGNKATLTLADGRTIDLNTEQSGIVVGDGISYLDGSAVYRPAVEKSGSPEEGLPGTEKGNPSTSHYVLSTPKGGTYQITLPDGSKVWLNAASTLKYPSRFDGTERIVTLEGEAYFEVSERWSVVGARSAREKIPFFVKTKDQIVEVLGTQFNITAYMDEPETKTTLVEGKVRIGVSTPLANASVPPTKHFTLKPGQQATLRGTIIDVQAADISSVVAWKEGYFVFNGTELRDAMKQLSRWYNVEVIYEGDNPRTPFFGKISRNDTLAEVLEILKAGKVNFRIEQRGRINRVVVMP